MADKYKVETDSKTVATFTGRTASEQAWAKADAYNGAGKEGSELAYVYFWDDSAVDEGGEGEWVIQ